MVGLIDPVTTTFNPSRLPVVVPQFDFAAAETRKSDIELCLRAAVEMTVLSRAEMIKEWVAITDALKSVSAQVEQKPNGGRPHGGVAEAARKLPLPGNQSESARRQFVSRAIRIAKIFKCAKIVAKEEKLDDNQTALLAIAAEETEEAQIEIAKTWRHRNRQMNPVASEAEAYTVTGLGRLDADTRQGLDQAINALSKKFKVVVVHIGPTNTANGGAQELRDKE